MKVSIAFMLVALSSCFGTSSSLDLPNMERLPQNEIDYYLRHIQSLTVKFEDAQNSEGADKDFNMQCTLQATLCLVSELAEKLDCSKEEILEAMGIPGMTLENMEEVINGGMSVSELSGEECEDFLIGLIKGLIEIVLGLLGTAAGPVTGILEGLPFIGDLLKSMGCEDGALLGGLLGGEGGLLSSFPLGDILGGEGVGALLNSIPFVGDFLGGKDGGLTKEVVEDLLLGGKSKEKESTVPQSETEVVEGSEIIDKESGLRQEDNIGGFPASMGEDKSSSLPMGAVGDTDNDIESIVGNIFAVPDGMNQGMTGQTFGESNLGYRSWPAVGIESVGGNSGNVGENTGGMFADQDGASKGETGQIVKENYASDSSSAAEVGESESGDEEDMPNEGSESLESTEESNVTKRRKPKGTFRGTQKSQGIGYADKDRTGKGKAQGNGGSKGKASGGWGIAGKGAGVEWGKAGKGTGVEWGKAGKGTGVQWEKAGKGAGVEWEKAGEGTGVEWGKAGEGASGGWGKAGKGAGGEWGKAGEGASGGWGKAGKGAGGEWGIVGKGKNGAAGGVGKTSGGKKSGNGFEDFSESFEYVFEEIATGDLGEYVVSGTSISDSGTSISDKEAALLGGQRISGGKREMNQFTPTQVNDGGVEIILEEVN